MYDIDAICHGVHNLYMGLYRVHSILIKAKEEKFSRNSCRTPEWIVKQSSLSKSTGNEDSNAEDLRMFNIRKSHKTSIM